MTEREIQAIVFDFDGTILDTETPEFQVWSEVYENHGGVLDMETWLTCVGGGAGLFDPYAYLENQIGVPVDRGAIRARRRPRYQALVAAQSFRPGIDELMVEAKHAGLPMGVASSSGRDWVVGHLSERGILEHFGVICTSDDVAEVKPDPALYRLAAERLGADPSRTVAIEDSLNGMLGAKRAGLRCIVVPNSVTATQDFSEADLVLESLASVTLATIETLIKA